jgi:hypothetical protein
MYVDTVPILRVIFVPLTLYFSGWGKERGHFVKYFRGFPNYNCSAFRLESVKVKTLGIRESFKQTAEF